MTRYSSTVAGLGTALAALALGAGTCEPEEPERVCIPGVTQTCSCPGERTGTQSCTEDGTAFGRCLCPTTDAALPDAWLPDVRQPDTALPDAARPDLPFAADALVPDIVRPDTLPRDRALGGPDRFGVDAGLPDSTLPDRAAADQAAADLASADTLRLDAGVPDLALPDTRSIDAAVPDSSTGSDAFVPYDAAGHAGVGESCNAVPCQLPLLCTGAGNYYCRVRCLEPFDGVCDPATEHCINVTTVDGGACVPGRAPPAACGVADPPCADQYVCLAPGSTQDWYCRYRCDPGAVDAGCPTGSCLNIIGQNGGGCL